MKVIENTKPRIHIVGESLTFMPGANELDTPEKLEAWEQAKDTIPLVAHHIEEGDLVEKNFDATAPAELPLDEALELASKTLDAAALEKMKAEDERPQVRAVIDAQLEKLGPTDEQKKAIEEQKKKDAKSRAEAKAAAKGKAAEKSAQPGQPE